MKLFPISKSVLFLFACSLLFTSCGTAVRSTTDPSGVTPIAGRSLEILQPSEEDTFTVDSPIPILFGLQEIDPVHTHIKVIVDEKPAQLIPLDSTLRMDVTGLIEGSHIIRAFLVDADGIYNGDPSTFTYRNFNVEEDNNLWSLLPTEPIMTVNTPQPGQVFKGPKVPVQAILTHYTYGSDNGGFIKFWYSKDGGAEKTERLKSTEPLILDLEPGAYFMRFQLFDWSGNQIDSNWTWQNTEFVVE